MTGVPCAANLSSRVRNRREPIMSQHQGHPPAQLLVYSFGAGADFEGRLVGALERIEAGGGVRILEALFVRRDTAEGGLTAFDLKGRVGGGLTAPLLSFRFDPAVRRRLTERALAGRDGMRPETLMELGDALEPGTALVALLIEHAWVRALDDAVARTGGSALSDEFVDATALAELAPELLGASGVRAPDSR
jgi:hypothetical protein